MDLIDCFEGWREKGRERERDKGGGGERGGENE
jgi:hypothetical protein